jgi:hypothetical protein
MPLRVWNWSQRQNGSPAARKFALPTAWPSCHASWTCSRTRFALESVPAAFYCFLSAHRDPERVILSAVNAGYDADSVASMAGNLVGAWHGAHVLQLAHTAWWEELEVRDELLDLGTRLARLAQSKLVGKSNS